MFRRPVKQIYSYFGDLHPRLRSWTYKTIGLHFLSSVLVSLSVERLTMGDTRESAGGASRSVAGTGSVSCSLSHLSVCRCPPHLLSPGFYCLVRQAQGQASTSWNHHHTIPLLQRLQGSQLKIILLGKISRSLELLTDLRDPKSSGVSRILESM